jgi:acetyl-CoA synthetase
MDCWAATIIAISQLPADFDRSLQDIYSLDMTDASQQSDPMDRMIALQTIYSDPQANAAHLLCDQHDPGSVAFTLVAPDLSSVDLTYGDLREESIRFAAALSALGVVAGDRVATLMGKSRAFLVSVLAIWRLGAVHVPLFTAFAPPAIAYRVKDSGCKIIVCDAAQRRKLDPCDSFPTNTSWKIVTTGPADAAALSFDDLVRSARASVGMTALRGDAPIVQIYTSGTTGTPKGVLVPLSALAAFRAYLEFGLGLQREDVYWNAADPGWAYGLFYAVIAPLATGLRSILFEGGSSPENAFAVLGRYGVTNFAAAPTVFRAMRASGIQAPTLVLRCASSAGEPLTPEVNDWAVQALGVAVHDHYGQTEMGMLVNNHHHPALQKPLKVGSMGQSMPGWKVAVLRTDTDEPADSNTPGRLAIDLRASPLVWFAGYVNDPSNNSTRFSTDGRWYFTEDTAAMDEDGYVYFSARNDDVIIMSGYRIGPVEVESVIVAHPAVNECAVVAEPDPVRGEILVAFVVPRNGVEPSDDLTKELQELVKKRFAAHAFPRRIYYVDSLPKTPSGKIQRFALRERLRVWPQGTIAAGSG